MRLFEFDISEGSIKCWLSSVTILFNWLIGASSHTGANVLISARNQSTTWQFCANTARSLIVGSRQAHHVFSDCFMEMEDATLPKCAALCLLSVPFEATINNWRRTMSGEEDQPEEI